MSAAEFEEVVAHAMRWLDDQWLRVVMERWQESTALRLVEPGLPEAG